MILHGSRLKVVHVTASLSESSGGPPRSIVGLTERLGERGVHIDIVTMDNRAHFGKEVNYDDGLVNVHRVPCFYSKRFRLLLSPGFAGALKDLAQGADIIHSHGVWLPVNHAAAVVSNELRVPHLVSIRGNFHSAGLQSSSWKKRLARRLFVDADIQSAACLHATSVDEEVMIRNLGFKNPVAVLPAGVSIPSHSTFEINEAYRKNWPHLYGRKVLLFLGRVHPHKGVGYLVDAWIKLFRENPGWHLVLAGADEDDTVRKLVKSLNDAGGGGSYSFVGSVTGVKKWALLANCQLLVLPSRSENFGHVVAEALVAGRPVLTTDTTPWRDLEMFDCGWRIPVGTQSLHEALEKVFLLPATRLSEMGENGAKLILQKYDSGRIAQSMRSVYEWIVDSKSGPPDCISF